MAYRSHPVWTCDQCGKEYVETEEDAYAWGPPDWLQLHRYVAGTTISQDLGDYCCPDCAIHALEHFEGAGYPELKEEV